MVHHHTKNKKATPRWQGMARLFEISLHYSIPCCDEPAIAATTARIIWRILIFIIVMQGNDFI